MNFDGRVKGQVPGCQPLKDPWSQSCDMTQRFVIRVKQLLQGREVVKSFKMNFQNLYIHLQFVSPFRSDSGSQNFCGGLAELLGLCSALGKG